MAEGEKDAESVSRPPEPFGRYYRLLEGCEWSEWMVLSDHFGGYALRLLLMQTMEGLDRAESDLHLQVVRHSPDDK